MGSETLANREQTLLEANMDETADTYKRQRFDYKAFRSTFQYSLYGAKKLSYVHIPPHPGNSHAPVLLLLHGHSSSLDEFRDVFGDVHEYFDVYAFDQPCSGASEDISQNEIAAYAKDSQYPPQRFGLYLLRDITKLFIRHVIGPTPNGLILAGGSLGGNVALWVAGDDDNLLTSVVVWSPGCAWAFDNLGRALGRDAAANNALQTWSQTEYLKAVYGPVAPGQQPQPYFWYWDCWGEWCQPNTACVRSGSGACVQCKQRPAKVPASGMYKQMGQCKVNYINESYNDTLTGFFSNDRAQWHWSIACETLTNSFQNLDTSGKTPIAKVRPRLTLLAGMNDNAQDAGLYAATRQLYLCRDKAGQQCDAFWLESTGHSVHNERPKTLAKLLRGAIG